MAVFGQMEYTIIYGWHMYIIDRLYKLSAYGPRLCQVLNFYGSFWQMEHTIIDGWHIYIIDRLYKLSAYGHRLCQVSNFYQFWTGGIHNKWWMISHRSLIFLNMYNIITIFITTLHWIKRTYALTHFFLC